MIKGRASETPRGEVYLSARGRQRKSEGVPGRHELMLISWHLGSEVNNAPRNVHRRSLTHEVSGEHGHKGNQATGLSYMAKDMVVLLVPENRMN